jgi:Trk-type K+ transport system membrane component
MPREGWVRDAARRFLNAVLIGDGFAALISLVTEHGFYLPDSEVYRIHLVDMIIVGLFAACVLLRWAIAADRRAYVRERWLELGLVVLLLLMALMLLIVTPIRRLDTILTSEDFRTVAKFFIMGMQSVIVLQLLLGLARLNESLAALRAKPAVVLLISYVILIFAGAGLLMMPKCTPGFETNINFVDALFVSTSAASVTGLSVIDIGRGLSVQGQWILLAIIQFGGLGLITFAAFLSYLERNKLGVGEMLMLRDIFGYDVIGEMGRFLGYILVITLGVELIGAGLVFVNLQAMGLSIGEQIRWSLFHSVSAFNNSGFALKDNAMLDYSGSWGMTLTMCSLVVIGGLGFPVLMGLMRYRLSSLAFVRKLILSPVEAQAIEPSNVSIQAKIVLSMTIVLIVGGAMLFWGLESTNVMLGRSVDEQIDVAIWHSVMSRTAGFNSVDIGALRAPTLMVLMVLMMIGASPVSTGGGVKTVGVAIILATLRSMIRGRPNVELFRRSIPTPAINLAFSTAAVYVCLAVFFSTILSVTDPDIWGDKTYLGVMFETVSALSTTGFSVGITPNFSTEGKIVLCFAMLLGRLGPLLLLLGLASRGRTARYEYPYEKVIVT